MFALICRYWINRAVWNLYAVGTDSISFNTTGQSEQNSFGEGEFSTLGWIFSPQKCVAKALIVSDVMWSVCRWHSPRSKNLSHCDHSADRLRQRKVWILRFLVVDSSKKNSGNDCAIDVEQNRKTARKPDSQCRVYVSHLTWYVCGSIVWMTVCWFYKMCIGN